MKTDEFEIADSLVVDRSSGVLAEGGAGPTFLPLEVGASEGTTAVDPGFIFDPGVALPDDGGGTGGNPVPPPVAIVGVDDGVGGTIIDPVATRDGIASLSGDPGPTIPEPERGSLLADGSDGGTPDPRDGPFGGRREVLPEDLGGGDVDPLVDVGVF